MYMSVNKHAKRKLPQKVVLQILQNFDESKLSTIPPRKPKGGEIYVLDSRHNHLRQGNFTADGYRFQSNGRKHPYIKDGLL